MQTALTVECNHFHANTIKIVSVSKFYLFMKVEFPMSTLRPSMQRNTYYTG